MTKKYGWCLDGHHPSCPNQAGELEPCSCQCHPKENAS